MTVESPDACVLLVKDLVQAIVSNQIGGVDLRRRTKEIMLVGSRLGKLSPSARMTRMKVS